MSYWKRISSEKKYKYISTIISFKIENINTGSLSFQTNILKNGTCDFTTINSPLLNAIANTQQKAIFILEDAVNYKESSIGLQYYAFGKGQYPFTLAVSKGWNHEYKTVKQRDIIKLILARKNELDINVQEHQFGFTALHIACLRGDDPEFIDLLLQHGADRNITDKKNRNPIVLLNLKYDYICNILVRLTCYNTRLTLKECSTASVNKREQIAKNSVDILKLLS